MCSKSLQVVMCEEELAGYFLPIGIRQGSEEVVRRASAIAATTREAGCRRKGARPHPHHSRTGFGTRLRAVLSSSGT